MLHKHTRPGATLLDRWLGPDTAYRHAVKLLRRSQYTGLRNTLATLSACAWVCDFAEVISTFIRVEWSPGTYTHTSLSDSILAIDTSLSSVVRTSIYIIRGAIGSMMSSTTDRRRVCTLEAVIIIVLRWQHRTTNSSLLASRINFLSVSTGAKCYQSKQNHQSCNTANYSTGDGANI